MSILTSWLSSVYSAPQTDMEDGRNPSIKKSLFPLFSSKNSLKHNSAVKVLPVVASPMVQHQPPVPYPASPVIQPRRYDCMITFARPHRLHWNLLSPEDKAKQTLSSLKGFQTHSRPPWCRPLVHPFCLDMIVCQARAALWHWYILQCLLLVRQHFCMFTLHNRSLLCIWAYKVIPDSRGVL